MFNSIKDLCKFIQEGAYHSNLVQFSSFYNFKQFANKYLVPTLGYSRINVYEGTLYSSSSLIPPIKGHLSYKAPPTKGHLSCQARLQMY